MSDDGNQGDHVMDDAHYLVFEEENLMIIKGAKVTARPKVYYEDKKKEFRMTLRLSKERQYYNVYLTDRVIINLVKGLEVGTKIDVCGEFSVNVYNNAKGYASCNIRLSPKEVRVNGVSYGHTTIRNNSDNLFVLLTYAATNYCDKDLVECDVSADELDKMIEILFRKSCK